MGPGVMSLIDIRVSFRHMSRSLVLEVCWMRRIGLAENHICNIPNHTRRVCIDVMICRLKMNAHPHVTGPHYDGNLGLGSMVSVRSMNDTLSDSTTRKSPRQPTPSERAWGFEASLHPDYRSSSYQRPSDEGASNRCYRPCVSNVNQSSRSAYQLIPRDTILPLTVHDSENQWQEQSIAAALEEYQAPHHPAGALYRGCRHEMQSSRDSVNKYEKRRRRKKHMTNLLFGSVFIAHVLITVL